MTSAVPHTESNESSAANHINMPHSESTTSQAFKLGSFAIDQPRPMRVVVIGAGYSGIIAGIRIPQRLKNIELVIYEKLAGVGGVWSVLSLDHYHHLLTQILFHCI